MDNVLCDITAFRYHRIPPQVLAVLPMLPQFVDDRRREAFCAHPLVADILGTPLHVATDLRGRNYTGRTFVKHLISGELPFGCVEQTDLDFDVASPLLTLFTMASHVSNERLIMAMYEFCGDFTVFDMPSSVSQLLKAAVDSGDLPSDYGWENVCDVNGKPTDLWRRDPLTTIHELLAFAYQMSGRKGAKAFLRAARCVTGICSSPFEVQVSMLLGLGRARGGEGFSIENNVDISLTRNARLISGTQKRCADILVYNMDKTDSCIVECQGRAIHGSVESKIADSDRTTALQSMGHEVVLVTYAQASDAETFSVVAKLIAERAGMALKEKSPLQKSHEKELRREIFIDWSQF